MKRTNFFLIGGVVVTFVATCFLMTGQINGNLISQPKTVPSGSKDRRTHELVSLNDAKEGVKDPNLTKQVNDLKKEVEELKRTVVSMHSELQTLASTRQVPANTVASIDPVTEREKADALRNQETERQHEQGEQLELNFREQTTDPDWAAKTKTLLHDALTSDKISTENIIDIDCRATMCRVELSNDNQHEAPKFTTFAMNIGAELPNIMVDQNTERDGSTTTVMYISKEEFALSSSSSSNKPPRI